MVAKEKKAASTDYRVCLVDVAGNYDDKKKASLIGKAVKRYFAQHGSGYVGISSNPKRRMKQHNTRNVKESGNLDMAWPKVG